MMNAMLVSSELPTNMWGEAILSTCHIQNKVPHKKTSKTPYELWEGRKCSAPDFNSLIFDIFI
jgi:hypothetical protein